MKVLVFVFLGLWLVTMGTAGTLGYFHLQNNKSIPSYNEEYIKMALELESKALQAENSADIMVENLKNRPPNVSIDISQYMSDYMKFKNLAHNYRQQAIDYRSLAQQVIYK